MNRDRNCKYKVNLQMTVTSRRNALITSHLREIADILNDVGIETGYLLEIVYSRTRLRRTRLKTYSRIRRTCLQ